MLGAASSERNPTGDATSLSRARPRWLTDRVISVSVWLVPALVALGVGGWGIRATSIDRDETATIDISTRSLHDIFRTVPNVDAVHALYYLVMHFWIGLFGTSALSIRLPSLIGTVIAAAVLAVLGTKLVSRRVGFTAGVLYAVAPMISSYAHDARSYGIDSAIVIVLSFCLVRAMSSSRRRAWIAYGAVLVVMVLSHLFTLLILPAHLITIGWYAVAERSWRAVRRWLATTALALGALSYFIYRAIAQGSTASWIPRPTWRTGEIYLLNITGGRLLVGPMLVLAAIGVFFSFRTRRVRPPGRADGPRLPSVASVALPWLVIPPVLLLGASLHDPLYVFRYVLYTLPALVLLVAYGLNRLLPMLRFSIPVLIALIALTAPMAVAVRSPALGANDLRGEARYIADSKRPGDSIVFLIPIQRQMMSSYPHAYAGLDDIARKQTGAQAANFFGRNVSLSTLQHRLDRAERVWAVKYWVTKASRPASHVIERERYAMFHQARLKWVSTKHFRGGAFLLFEREPTPKPAHHASRGG